MKIVYLGNFGNPYSDATEKHIKYAFEQLGHEVIIKDEASFDIDDIVKTCRDEGDMFLFHKGGEAFDVELPDLIELLNKITIPKVFWYFDKVFDGDRENWMHTVIPYVEHGFLTDETWVRRQNYENISVLRQGIGNEDVSLGKEDDEFKYDVVFFGTIYDEHRSAFVRGLQETYGDRFRVFSDVFGRELFDACASAKVIVSPRSPQDDFYWSSRVYMMTGSGGFLIYPKLEALKEEFEPGKEIVMYASGHQLKDKIDYYLKPENEEERKAIQKAGYEKCINNYTYQNRVETLVERLKVDGIV